MFSTDRLEFPRSILSSPQNKIVNCPLYVHYTQCTLMQFPLHYCEPTLQLIQSAAAKDSTGTKNKNISHQSCIIISLDTFGNFWIRLKILLNSSKAQVDLGPLTCCVHLYIYVVMVAKVTSAIKAANFALLVVFSLIIILSLVVVVPLPKWVLYNDDVGAKTQPTVKAVF